MGPGPGVGGGVRVNVVVAGMCYAHLSDRTELKPAYSPYGTVLRFGGFSGMLKDWMAGWSLLLSFNQKLRNQAARDRGPESVAQTEKGGRYHLGGV